MNAFFINVCCCILLDNSHWLCSPLNNLNGILLYLNLQLEPFYFSEQYAIDVQLNNGWISDVPTLNNFDGLLLYITHRDNV